VKGPQDPGLSHISYLPPFPNMHYPQYDPAYVKTVQQINAPPTYYPQSDVPAIETHSPIKFKIKDIESLQV